MKILSLNGGGALGYITVSLLEKFEEEAQKPCYEVFDLIAGVSTGSIIGYGLSKGFTAKEIREKYENLVPEIFKNKRGFIMSLFYPYYDIKVLENSLKEHLGELDITKTKTKFMCYATKVSKPAIKPKFWKSWRTDEPVKAYKALAASSAAPLFFSPYEINDEVFVDGGMITNSPNVTSIVEAIKLGAKLSDIEMLNFSYNTTNAYKKKDMIGLIKVAQRVPELSIWGTERIESHEAQQLLELGKFNEISPLVTLGIDNTNFDAMKKIADDIWKLRKEDILAILEKDQ